jgi:hypothetical protein
VSLDVFLAQHSLFRIFYSRGFGLLFIVKVLSALASLTAFASTTSAFLASLGSLLGLGLLLLFYTLWLYTFLQVFNG